MYIDKELLLSDGQDMGDAVGTRVSTNTINMGAAKAIGKGKQMYVVVVIDEAFATSTSINFQVVTDTEATLGSPTVQIETGAIAIASLTAGRAPIIIPIGSAIGTEEQYLGMQYTEAGTGSTAGKITAFVAFDVQSN